MSKERQKQEAQYGSEPDAQAKDLAASRHLGGESGKQKGGSGKE